MKIIEVRTQAELDAGGESQMSKSKIKKGGAMQKQIVMRQGDVILKRLPGAANIEGGKERPDLVLAYGEVTGHSHQIAEGRAQLYALVNGVVILRVLSEYAKLYHEEHEDITLPKGDYEVIKQREYDWLSDVTRDVTD